MEKLLDTFAAYALSALIQKMPMLDAKGEFGKQLTDEEHRSIKKDLCASAYEYASYMIISRQKSVDWLKENEKLLSQ